MAKKIKLAIVYVVLAALVVLTILGFCIPVSYIPEINAPYTITITSSDGYAEYEGFDVQNNKERYDVFYEKYDNSMKQSFFASLFSGNLFYKNRIELISSKPSYKGYKMAFTYATEQTVRLNGKDYADTTDTSTVLKFTRLYFDVVNTDGIQLVNMFYEVPTVVNGTNKTLYYSRKVLADFSEVYQAIVDAQ